jgi:hypothetical protein
MEVNAIRRAKTEAYQKLQEIIDMIWIAKSPFYAGDFWKASLVQ